MKAFGVTTGVAGSFCLPHVIGKAMEGFDWEDDFELAEMSDSKRNFLIGLTIAALPVSIALSPITAPVLAIASAKSGLKNLKRWEGDLTEDWSYYKLLLQLFVLNLCGTALNKTMTIVYYRRCYM